MSPVKVALHRLGWTNQQLVDACKAKGWDTSASYINQVANGHRYPSRDKARVLAEVLGCGAGEILAWQKPAPDIAPAAPSASPEVPESGR